MCWRSNHALLHVKLAFNYIFKHDNDKYPVSSTEDRGGFSSHRKYIRGPTSSQQECWVYHQEESQTFELEEVLYAGFKI